jgi:hypothetical protein
MLSHLGSRGGLEGRRLGPFGRFDFAGGGMSPSP